MLPTTTRYQLTPMGRNYVRNHKGRGTGKLWRTLAGIAALGTMPQSLHTWQAIRGQVLGFWYVNNLIMHGYLRRRYPRIIGNSVL